MIMRKSNEDSYFIFRAANLPTRHLVPEEFPTLSTNPPRPIVRTSDALAVSFAGPSVITNPHRGRWQRGSPGGQKAPKARNDALKETL